MNVEHLTGARRALVDVLEAKTLLPLTPEKARETLLDVRRLYSPIDQLIRLVGKNPRVWALRPLMKSDHPLLEGGVLDVLLHRTQGKGDVCGIHLQAFDSMSANGRLTGLLAIIKPWLRPEVAFCWGGPNRDCNLAVIAIKAAEQEMVLDNYGRLVPPTEEQPFTEFMVYTDFSRVYGCFRGDVKVMSLADLLKNPVQDPEAVVRSLENLDPVVNRQNNTLGIMIQPPPNSKGKPLRLWLPITVTYHGRLP